MRRSPWTEGLRGAGLIALYFLVVSPIGLCVRVVRDPLSRSWESHRTSYLHHPPRSRDR